VSFQKITKIVFLGTSKFSLKTLEALIDLEKKEPKSFQLSLVIIQPDRKSGRGQKIKLPPVKNFLLENNLEKLIRQPEKIKQDQVLIKELKLLKADLFVTSSYGQIISSEILEIPEWGVWNVHASLLPSWRGAAPIPWAIISGDRETGISIMQTELGLDTGDILNQEKTQISKKETSQSLEEKLSVMGAELLIKTIRLKLENKIVPQKQNQEKSTYAKKIDSQLAKIDFRFESATQIERKIRALSLYQKVYFIAKNSLSVKIIQAEVEELSVSQGINSISPGQIIKIDSTGILVKCKEKALLIKVVQLPGKKAVKALDWYNGQRKDLVGYF